MFNHRFDENHNYNRTFSLPFYVARNVLFTQKDPGSSILPSSYYTAISESTHMFLDKIHELPITKESPFGSVHS